ncbi:MAG: hypothetical protein IJ254_09785 [Succinivibrio sp.]|jgi:hypothetical protein|nr:hypothetical protein [Succinivibrio sp.]
MSTPIKVIPTLTGKDAKRFLKNAEETERRYKQMKEAGTLRDITENPSYKLMKKLSSNILVLK